LMKLSPFYVAMGLLYQQAFSDGQLHSKVTSILERSTP
jgi:hypothetical protein